MSSDFDTHFAALNTGFFDYWGESITYTPTGSSGSAVTAAVDRGRLERLVDHDDPRGTVEKLRMPIKVQTSDVATRTPGKDSVTIDGAEWAVAEEIGISGGVSQLIVERDATKEYHAPGHRRRR